MRGPLHRSRKSGGSAPDNITQFCMGCNTKCHRASQGVREYKGVKGKKHYIFCERLLEPDEAQTIIDLAILCFLKFD